MTHAGVAPELKKAIGITERLIRISIGVENHADLITDLSTAFDAVKKTNK
jgi:cystathionine gamma-synthase